MSDKDQINPHFFQLVLSLQSAAMFQMGKTASPITGKVEKDMMQARSSIDMLVMIQKKTEGNLSDEEKRILDSTVYTLQMNFLDESQKSDDTETEETAGDQAPEESPENKSDSAPDSEPS